MHISGSFAYPLYQQLRLLLHILRTFTFAWLSSMRRRMLSSCTMWADSAKLSIITTTRWKSGLASTWSTRGMRRPGSTAGCNSTFHCPVSNIAGYYLAQDKIINPWDIQSLRGQLKQRKRRRNSKWNKLHLSLMQVKVWNIHCLALEATQVYIFKIWINLHFTCKHMCYMLEYAHR